MPTFDVLSGTWYHITAPDLETAEKAYDAYWNVDEQLPEGCKVVEGEVDSYWEGHTPNETTLEAMKEALEEPAPPTGFEPKENAW